MLFNETDKKAVNFGHSACCERIMITAMPDHPPGLIALRLLRTRLSGLSFFPFFLLKRSFWKRESNKKIENLNF